MNYLLKRRLPIARAYWAISNESVAQTRIIYVNKSSDAIECFLRHRILYYRKRKQVISECRIRCFENRIEPKVVRKLLGDVTLNKGSKESNQRCNLSIKY